MREIVAKTDNVGDVLGADAFNANLRSELQNIAAAGGFTLDPEAGPDTDLNMLGKTLAMYGSGAHFYSESGSANAYVLTRSGTLKNVRAYFDGMIICFIPGNANTGASTVNVATLGVKSLVLPSGAALSGGELKSASFVLARFNYSADYFELIFSGVLQLPVPVSGSALKNVQVNSDATGFELVGPLSNFKNKIINGDFDIWQREFPLAGLSASETYVADRWLMSLAGTSFPTVDVAQGSFTLGQTAVPGEPEFYHSADVTTGGSADEIVALVQKIEGVRTLAGENAVVSFYAKADSALDMTVELYQNFGSTGSPSSPVTGIGINKVSLTTSWQKFELPISIPSISGKTLGTAGNDLLAVLFWLSGGSDYDSRTDTLGNQTGVFDIAQVQIEIGANATSFEKRLKGVEEALCFRYFEKSYAKSNAPGSTTVSGYITFEARAATSQLISFSFTATKRTVPTMTLYSPTTGTSGKVRNSTTSVDITGSVANISDTGGGYITLGSAPSAGDFVLFHYTANAEL